jgi:hypothetical protein
LRLPWKTRDKKRIASFWTTEVQVPRRELFQESEVEERQSSQIFSERSSSGNSTEETTTGKEYGLNLQTKLRQARAAMVAEYAFKQRLERIEWEEAVLKPTMERLALEAAETLQIPEFIIHEDYEN